MGFYLLGGASGEASARFCLQPETDEPFGISQESQPLSCQQQNQ
jgi:hypothetical protein